MDRGISPFFRPNLDIERWFLPPLRYKREIRVLRRNYFVRGWVAPEHGSASGAAGNFLGGVPLQCPLEQVLS